VAPNVRVERPASEPGDKGLLGQCSLCSAQILFTDCGKLDRPTGWAWFNGPDAHLQPICGRCHALHKRRTEQS
jgi:hypothetical protein